RLSGCIDRIPALESIKKVRGLQHRLKDQTSAGLERSFARPIRVEERLEILHVALGERAAVQNSAEAADETVATFGHGVGAGDVRRQRGVPPNLFGNLRRQKLVRVRSGARRQQGGIVVAKAAAGGGLVVGNQSSGGRTRELQAEEI